MLRKIADQLRETLLDGKGMPGWFFTSNEFLQAEKQYFFRNSWICIGLESDVIEPGDVCPVTVLDQPLLVVRGRDAALRVFHNVCSHRGTQLVSEARKCATIVCPYHAWAYGLDGQLKQTPHAGGANVHECEQVDKNRLGLKEVRSATWAGLVFVNLSGDAASLQEHLRPLADRWRRIDLSLLRHVPASGQQPIVNANWKLVVENFVESYHLPWVHSSMNAFNPMGAHYQILGADHYIGQGVKAHNPDDVYAGRFKHFPGLNEDELGTGESMYVPANLILITMSDFMFSNILIPEAPGRTAERIEMFLIGEDASHPDLQHERQKLMNMLARVNDEDISICELAQKGRNSEAFTGGVFAPAQEQSTLQFQQLIARRMLSAKGGAGVSLPELPVDDIHHPIPRSDKLQN